MYTIGDLDDIRVLTNGILTRILNIENKVLAFPEDPRNKIEVSCKEIRKHLDQMLLVVSELKISLAVRTAKKDAE